MPLQYSWSCKRNYKSGYVWCDLALNDIIHPTEGAEYILKGSEFVQASSAILVSFFSCSPSPRATRHWWLSILILVLRHQRRHWYTYLVKLEEPHHQFSIYHNLMFGGKLLINNSELSSRLC
ncbi:hypothetical protein AAHE18_18G148700 [Arachis hypogaea]